MESLTSAHSDGPLLLFTLPVYNEANRLEACIERVSLALDASRVRYVLAVAEDGSDDGTKRALEGIVERWPRLVLQSLEQRRGRGYALRRLWSRISADVYGFTDVDLASGVQPLMEGLQRIAAGADVVTGSRYLPESQVIRPPLRMLVSKGYNRLVQLMFNDKVNDHQCGLKLFTRKAITSLLGSTSEDSWFWDTEILVRANAEGMTISEIPVRWQEKKTKRTGVSRLVSDLYLHGTGLIRLRSEVQRSGVSRARPARQVEDRGMPVFGPSSSHSQEGWLGSFTRLR